MSQKVLIIGGKGFIGYHLVENLVWSGYSSFIASRHEDTLNQKLGTEIYFDLAKQTDQELKAILSKFSVVVFCGGTDDRRIGPEEAWKHFYLSNVEPCKKLASLCNKAKVQKFIILGSYFSYFNRTYPEWKMDQVHPYVNSRTLQLQDSITAAGNNTKVSAIEIPYVFGSAPGLIPLWCPLISYIRSFPFVFYTKGGTNCISVLELTHAICKIIDIHEYREFWTVGGVNLSWKEMIDLISKALGLKRTVITVPSPVVKTFAFFFKIYLKLKASHPGLDPYYFAKTQCSHTYLDSSEIRGTLNYKEKDIEKAIKDTVNACP